MEALSINFSNTPSLPALEYETGEFYLTDQLRELYYSNPIITDFIDLNTLPYEVLENDPDLSYAWANILRSPPKQGINPFIINSSFTWTPLNMIKLGKRRVSRKGFYRYDPLNRSNELERIKTVYLAQELPFHPDDMTFVRQGRCPKLDQFYNILKPCDRVEALNYATSLHSTYEATFPEFHQALVDYFIKLYRHSSLDSVKLANSNFKTGPTKSNRRFNRKILSTLTTHLDSFIDHSSSDNFEQQVGFLSNIEGFISGIGKTDKVVDKFSNLLDRFDIVADKAQSTTTSISQSASNITDMTSTLLSSSTTTTAASMVERAKKNLPIILLHLRKLFVLSDYADWTLSLTSIMSILGLNELLYDRIMSIFTPKHEEEQLFVRQSAKVKLLALISSFLGNYSPVKLLTDSNAFTFMREQKAVTEMLNLLEELAIEAGIMSSPEVELANTLKQDVSHLLEKYAYYTALLIEKPGKFLFSTTSNQFDKDYNRLHEIEKILITRDLKYISSTTLKSEVAKLRDNYNKLRETILTHKRASSIRQEPFAVCFLGASGIGKSKFTLELASSQPGKPSALARRFAERGFADHLNWADLDVPNWQIWNECLSSGTQYSDGYIGQDIHVVDDIFQAGDDSEHEKWINYVSPAKYLTNQAALESKGFPYTSKLCLTSCNKFPRSSKTIKEIAALQRRFCIVHTTQVSPTPANYDPKFSHLKFTVYKTAGDYMHATNSNLGTEMTFDQLTDYILDCIQRKFKMYCETIGMDYERQAGYRDIKVVTHEQFMKLAEEATVINTADIFTDPSKRYHRIFVRPNSKLLDMFPSSCTRLIEIARQYPEIRDTEVLFKYFESWIDSSQAFLTKSKNCAVSTKDRCFYFDSEGNIFATPIISNDDGDFDIDEESWMDWFYAKFPSPFVNLASSIYKTFFSTFHYLSSFLSKTWDYAHSGFSKFVKLTGLEAIMVWLFPESITHSLFSWIRNTVVSLLFGSIALVVYSKITRFFMSDICDSCNTSTTRNVQAQLSKLSEAFCNDNCKLGYMYTDHILDCQQMPLLCKQITALYCCNGNCQNSCKHNIDTSNIDPRTLEPLFEVLDTYCRQGRHCLLPFLPYNIQEASDQSRRVKPKTTFNVESSLFEASNTSTRSKPKTKFDVEGSDNSQRAKKKTSFKVEGSENSQKLKPKTQFTVEEFKDSEFFCREAQVDPAAYTVLESVSDIMTPVENHTSRTSLWGWGYLNNVLCPCHIINRPDCELWVKDASGTSVRAQVVTTRPDKDIALLSFKGNPFKATIERHLATRSDIQERLQDNQGAVMAVKRSKNLHILHPDYIAPVVNKTIVYSPTDSQTYSELLQVNGVRTSHLATTSGDCGSPLFVLNKRMTRKLLGFHVIANSSGSMGFSALVTLETFKDMLGSDTAFTKEMSYGMISCGARLPVVDTMDLVQTESDHSYLASEGDIEYVGEYRYNAVPAKDSNLLQHRLYETFPVTQIPAALNNDEIEDKTHLHPNGFGKPDILQTQLNKYKTVFSNPPNIDTELSDMVEQFGSYMSSVLDKYDLSPLTEEETLSGLESDDLKGMDLRTTAGEPFSRWGTTPGKKKKQFLKERINADNKKMYTFNRDVKHALDLIDEINLKEKLAHKGIRTLSIWKNCLKDETRPILKRNIGKTRLFTAAPFDTVYLGRKYFGRFIDSWKKERLPLLHSVGINPVSPDWTFLAQDLLSHGSNFYDADYSSYDGKLRADFMRAAGQIVRKCINQNDTLLETLWEEYVETFHVGYRTVQLIKHGNPSGNPLTTVVNCIVNMLYHWYAYRRITNRTSFSSFKREVGFTCFGDDVVFCSDPTSDYTFSNVAKIMKELGQDYTTAAKNSNDSGARDISEITFLKRRFKKDKSIYLAPLDTESIEQQFNYTYIGPNDFITIQTQIDEALFEASLHGSNYYNIFRACLQRAFTKDNALHQNCTLMNYSDAHTLMLKRVYDDGKASLC